MPKKPRQAHIPTQAVKRRRVRRPFMQTVPTPGTDAYEAGSNGDAFAESPEAATASAMPVRQRRRLEAVRAPSETATVYRTIPGQLPTFDRHYLMRELRQIAVMSTSLLAVIIVLAIVLR